MCLDNISLRRKEYYEEPYALMGHVRIREGQSLARDSAYSTVVLHKNLKEDLQIYLNYQYSTKKYSVCHKEISKSRCLFLRILKRMVLINKINIDNIYSQNIELQ